MAFTESAPSTSILNGNAAPGATYIGGTTTAPKTTTKRVTTHKAIAKQGGQIQFPNSTQSLEPATSATNSQPLVLVPAEKPYQYHTEPGDFGSLWNDLGTPLILVLILVFAFFKFLSHSIKKNPVQGYAHKHKVHHPGKMNPRVFKHH